MDIAYTQDRNERAEQSQPKKLYKPRREQGELEVVITYATECDNSTMTTGTGNM